MTVLVKDSGFGADGKVDSTTVNGDHLVHGVCSKIGKPMDDRGFFTCAHYVELPAAPLSTYEFKTTTRDGASTLNVGSGDVQPADAAGVQCVAQLLEIGHLQQMRHSAGGHQAGET